MTRARVQAAVAAVALATVGCGGFSIYPPSEPAMVPRVVDVDAVRAQPAVKDPEITELVDTPNSTTALVKVMKQVPPHIHERSDETIYVLSGHGELLLQNDWQTVSAGALIHVPQGIPHAYVNHAEEGSVVLVTYAPHFVEGDRVPVDYAR